MQIDADQWREMSTLIDRMLELPMEERETWVRSLTGPDARLAPQLLQMLAGADEAKTASTSPWFDTLPKFFVDAGVNTAAASSAGSFEQPGDEIGPYTLVRVLGRGGMGSVWYAERSDKLVKRGVALKLPAGGGKQLAARFERERDIVASLSHPHIARLYDAGITSSGQAYLALEYVEGQSLDAYCDQQKLGLRQRVRLFCQVLGAVQYAHSRLVIHRDLKPANILVTTEGYVRLLDFGVAKLVDGDTPDEASELTRLADAAMTLAYASPEQISGAVVSTATDIYSLGVVLYELLVGVRPYRVRRSTRAALEEAILRADIPLPSAISIGDEAAQARGGSARKLSRELRGDLDAIVLKALSPQPAQRYATATEFADDLLRFLDRRPVRAHRPSRWYAFHKFVGRNRYAVGGATLAAVVLMGAAGVALWQAREAKRQEEIAASERDRALAAVAHREAVDDFMSDLLLEAGRTGKPISVTALIARADELSKQDFANNPEGRAAVLKTIAVFDEDLVGREKELSDLDQAQVLLANSRDAGLRASVACNRAAVLGGFGKYAEASAVFQQQIADPLTPELNVIDCLYDSADLAVFRHDGPAAMHAIRLAQARWDALPQKPLRTRLRLRILEAEAQNLLGNPAQADGLYAQIEQELKQMGRQRGPIGDEVRYFRIAAAIDSGDPHLALRLIDSASQMLANDAPDRTLPVFLRYDRCFALKLMGRDEEALVGFKKITGEQDFGVSAMLNAALILAQSNRLQEAQNFYAQASQLASNGDRGGGGGFKRLFALTRAQLDLVSNNPKAARIALEPMLRATTGSRLMIFEMSRLRALADLAEHDTDDALRDAKLSLETSVGLRGDKPYSRAVGLAQFTLGEVLMARGDRIGALQAYEIAVEQLGHSVDANASALIQARSRLRSTA